MSIIIFLSIFACITSGLCVGYMSIDDLVLEIKSKTGTDEEKIHAARILLVVADRHRMLITLLIWMAGCMESLPIFLSILSILNLDLIVSELVSLVIAVGIVLFIGYIIPQAICTGPDQIRIASWWSTFTRVIY